MGIIFREITFCHYYHLNSEILGERNWITELLVIHFINLMFIEKL